MGRGSAPSRKVRGYLRRRSDRRQRTSLLLPTRKSRRDVVSGPRWAVVRTNRDRAVSIICQGSHSERAGCRATWPGWITDVARDRHCRREYRFDNDDRSEEHTSELQSPDHLVCRLLLEKKKNKV